MLVVDGSVGEGGGQVLRTCLSLSAITGRPFHIDRIRAGRRKPGLRPQHLTAVRAVAALCGATVSGAALNGTELWFTPQHAPRGGTYAFDVADAASGGSAGAVTLILQAVLWPLLFADGPSEVRLNGGTHVPFSPPYHYFASAACPTFARLGVDVVPALEAWGWLPRGEGAVTARIRPVDQLKAATFAPERPMTVDGVAAAANLPAHIPQRIASRANNLLEKRGMTGRVAAVRTRGASAGAGLFLWLPQAGFSALGRKGLPSEAVAEAAVADLGAFLDNQAAAVDPHLADQLLLPLALAAGTSRFTTNRLTRHALTNAHLLRRWFDLSLQIDGNQDDFGTVTVAGVGWSRLS